MKNRLNHILATSIAFILSSVLQINLATADQIEFTPYPAGMKFQYGKKGEISKLEVIYSNKEFVIFEHIYENGKPEYLLEYKGLLTVYCNTKRKTLKEDITAVDKLWPLKLGNSAQSSTVSYLVTKEVIKNTHLPKGKSVLVINSKQKGIVNDKNEETLQSYYWPKHQFIMVKWPDDTEVISLPEVKTANSDIPVICKQNIPDWFWKKLR